MVLYKGERYKLHIRAYIFFVLLFAMLLPLDWCGVLYMKVSRADQGINKEVLSDSSGVSGQTSSVELLFWESIKDSSNPKMFDEYLRQFPEGIFFGIARLRRQELEEKLQKEKVHGRRGKSAIGEGEADAWIEAEASGMSELYRRYMEQYPEGFCGVLAKVRLADAKLWEDIQRTSNPQTVEHFIRNHPNSPFSRKAIDYLDVIMSKSSPSLTHTGGASLLKQELGKVESCDIQSKIRSGEQRAAPRDENYSGERNGENSLSEPKNVRLVSAKQICSELGYIEKTTAFGTCVMKVMFPGE